MQFFISVCLARLLSPKEFGVVAILSVFIVIGGIILDCGWGTALVQRKELDNADCSSVFWINLVTALVLYAGLWISAPLISTFYDDTVQLPDQSRCKSKLFLAKSDQQKSLLPATASPDSMHL